MTWSMKKRSYEQSARAESAAATAERILDATTELVMERWLDEITLEQIAERAEVNVRTVIRRFESRDEVVQAAVERFRTRLAAGPVQPPPPPGDVGAAVRWLVEYYEQDGAFLLRGLAQEARFAFLRTNFEGTRARHRAWVKAAFAPQLAALAPKRRERKVSELAVITWVTTWEFLRHHSASDRADTEKTLRSLVDAVTSSCRGAS
jgi:AcrR family transcriptional regulator